MDQFVHSVTLEKRLCNGCTNCIKRCPTGAIRVRDGKAAIIPVPKGDASAFIGLGGRIPAPIHSLKN